MLNKLTTIEWAKVLRKHLPDDYFQSLGKFLAKEYTTNTVFPPIDDIFNAFKFTDYKDVTVLFLGLDPYIREGQAYGVSFGIKDSCMVVPPSLRNIAKEVENDIYCGFKLCFDLTLQSWCSQGCFMYNTALTVIEGKTGSHLKYWAKFTESVIKALNEKDFCIFVLLGRNAQEYEKFINTKDSFYIVKAPHPSAESYAGGKAGFFGSKIFSKINEILKDNNKEIIKW